MPKQAVTHTIKFESFVLGTNMSNPSQHSNSNARTDIVGPSVEFGSTHRTSGASSWSLDLVKSRS